MNYAMVEDGVVTNIICLSPSNAKDFPNAVQTNGLPVRVGDIYADGAFYRDGERLLSAAMMLNELTGGVEDVQYE